MKDQGNLDRWIMENWDRIDCSVLVPRQYFDILCVVTYQRNKFLLSYYIGDAYRNLRKKLIINLKSINCIEYID